MHAQIISTVLIPGFVDQSGTRFVSEKRRYYSCILAASRRACRLAGEVDSQLRRFPGSEHTEPPSAFFWKSRNRNIHNYSVFSILALARNGNAMFCDFVMMRGRGNARLLGNNDGGDVENDSVGLNSWVFPRNRTQNWKYWWNLNSVLPEDYSF